MGSYPNDRLYVGALTPLVSATTHRNDSSKERLTVQPSEIADVLRRPVSQEQRARDSTRLAYVEPT